MDQIPFDDRHVPRAEIEWDRSAWWWYPLSRALHPAMRMFSLLFSMLAVWLLVAGLRLGEWIFEPRWQAFELRPLQSVTLEGLWQIGSEFLLALLSLKIGIPEIAFLTFLILWFGIVCSLFGGVLTRRSLVELGQRTIAPWGNSITLVWSRWLSFLWSSGMHLVGIAVLLVPIFLLGLLSRLGEPGAHIAGWILLLLFPIVFGVGRLGFSLVFCFPLSIAAITAEKKADAFEGFSRSNAYFSQRPVVAAICILVLAAVGTVGGYLVSWILGFGWAVVRETYFFSGGTAQPASEWYIRTGNWLLLEVVTAYWFSFFWSAVAATYLILRKSVDHTELSELDLGVDDASKEIPDLPAQPGSTPAGEPQAPANSTSGDSTSDSSTSDEPAPESPDDKSAPPEDSQTAEGDADSK